MDFIKLLLFGSFLYVAAQQNSCPTQNEPNSCETANGKLEQFYSIKTETFEQERDSCVPTGANNISECEFTQELDHYDPSNTQTFKQRYFVNSEFNKSGGPAFIYIGGEGEADINLMTNDGYPLMWVEWAKKHGALAFQLEHRYYGKSFPKEIFDLSVENLKYLTSDQALADLANFRDKMAAKYKIPNAKWIVFGYSYAGSLAAWLLHKYPDKFHGAVASSAPLLAKVNFQEYLEVVSKVINDTDIKCDTAIRGAIMELEALVLSSSGAKYVTEQFNLCTKLDIIDYKSVTNLYKTLHHYFKDVVQYDLKYKNKALIIELCNIMTNGRFGNTLVERYAYLPYRDDCLRYDYNDIILDLQTESLPEPRNSERQWMYQLCNEFGFFQTTDSPSQPFGRNVPFKFFLEQCEDIFGANFSPDNVRANIAETNAKYGGNNASIYKNLPVIFPNGGCDPWSELGIKTEEFFVGCAAHCGDAWCDQSDPACEEPPDCRKRKEAIAAKIEEWLKS